MAISRIAVSGLPNSGKSTLTAKLALILGYTRHYTGGIFREMASAKGMTIEEFYPTVTPDVERVVDHIQEHRMRTETRIIVEGRVAPFLAPDIPKITVFLAVDPRIGAERAKLRAKEFAKLPVEEIMKVIGERVAAERAHYRTIYGIEDHMDSSRFDLVIDTSDLTPLETTTEALKRLLGRIEQ